MPVDDPSTLEEVARLVHVLRQPLSALVLLADNLQQSDLPPEARATAAEIAAQITEAVQAARQISRLVE